MARTSKIAARVLTQCIHVAGGPSRDDGASTTATAGSDRPNGATPAHAAAPMVEGGPMPTTASTQSSQSVPNGDAGPGPGSYQTVTFHVGGELMTLCMAGGCVPCLWCLNVRACPTVFWLLHWRGQTWAVFLSRIWMRPSPDIVRSCGDSGRQPGADACWDIAI